MSDQAVRNVRMGELAVADGGRLFTLLGSCVGIVLYDRRRKIGGLAHVVLPASNGDHRTPGKFVDTAVPELLRQIKQAGAAGLVSARIAGGADMFNSGAVETVGGRNIEAAEAMLSDMRIVVTGRDCGGRHGRRLTLDVVSGKVYIEQVGSPEKVEI